MKLDRRPVLSRAIPPSPIRTVSVQLIRSSKSVSTCPSGGSTYADESLAFCLQDGTKLRISTNNPAKAETQILRDIDSQSHKATEPIDHWAGDHSEIDTRDANPGRSFSPSDAPSINRRTHSEPYLPLLSRSVAIVLI